MFLSKFENLSQAYSGQYNLVLVLLSLLVSSIAVFIAFRISERMQRSRKQAPWLSRFWLLCGALVMGVGFWGLNFMGLLALTLPVPSGFNPLLTFAFVLPAILGSIVVLQVKVGRKLSHTRQWLTATGLGLGVGLMQFAGIAALDIKANIRFDAAWFSLTLLGAIGLSYLALKVKWQMDLKAEKGRLNVLPMVVSSLTLSISALAIHQVAMLATYFFPAPEKQMLSQWLPLATKNSEWLIPAGVVVLSLAAYGLVRLSHRLALATMLERGIDYAMEALNASTEGIVATNGWGTIKSFNSAAEKMFGYSAAEAIGQNCLFLLPEKSRESNSDLLANSGPGLIAVVNRVHELEFIKANGSKFSAEVVISALSRHGKIEFVGVIKDITSRQRLARNKELAQKKLEFLLSASPVIIYARKVKGSLPYSYVSPNLQNLLEYTPEQVLANSDFWNNLVHPEDAYLCKLDSKALRKDLEDTIEYRIQMPDGSYRWIEDTRNVTIDENGKPAQLIGSWVDIEDRKATEQVLALHMERLNISLKCARMATWDWIIETGEVIWSEDMQLKLGLATHEKPNFKMFIQIVHPEDREDVKAAFKQSLVRGDPFDVEYRIVWSDQSIHWMHSVGGLISDETGNPSRMVGVLYEISERKKLHLTTPEPAVILKSSAMS